MNPMISLFKFSSKVTSSFLLITINLLILHLSVPLDEVFGRGKPIVVEAINWSFHLRSCFYLSLQYFFLFALRSRPSLYFFGTYSLDKGIISSLVIRLASYILSFFYDSTYGCPHRCTMLIFIS